MIHPVADPPIVTTAEARAQWHREDANLELVYSGRVGTIRPIHCLEAALFAYHHERADQLTQPSEMIVFVLRKDRRLRVYAGRGDSMYPPKSVYGVTEVTADHAAGWQLVANLHNHTIRSFAGKPALGVTVPSTNDVKFLRGLVDELGLPTILVTNGVFTIDVPAASLATLQAAD
ncbi:MAG: hypothetical protein NT062_05885 [Proteobacteria bacterium]|nr:hypothetical protein [Pseudomonadota bacterium]